MRVFVHSLPGHGSGPLRQLAILSLGWLVRFSIGGYGNIPSPAGLWRWFPTVRWPYGYFHVLWLNMSLSVFPPRRAKDVVLIGYRQVFGKKEAV